MIHLAVPQWRLKQVLCCSALLLTLILAGCAANRPTEAPGPTARLRITNQSEYDLENLVVLFPEERITFGTVAAGETSDYQPAPQGVYRYAAYALVVDGKPVEQPVVDWVGESPVEGHDFTFVLDVNPNRAFPRVVELVEARKER